MRPDPSDIIAKKRLQKSRGRGLYMNQPLKPIDFKFIKLLIGVLFLPSIIALSFFNFDGFVNYINRPVTKIKMENQWTHIDSQEVKNVVAARMGAGFFRFDMNGLKFDLEKLSWVDSIITIIDVPLLKSSDEPLMERLKNYKTLSYPNIDRIRGFKEILNSPIYRDYVISNDGKTSGVVIYLKKDERLNEYIKLKEKYFLKQSYLFLIETFVVILL